MEKYDVYGDIAKRAEGDIFIGVVGPVRTGKSTFISKFMEKLVLPNMTNKLDKQIATDEMPQSADGKMIMTTQPKFIPQEAVKVQFKSKATAQIRLIDCVGYLVDGAVGSSEDGVERLVKTPWSEKEMPFEKAAEYGTSKVIDDYSTIGILVTTDGSFTGLNRKDYERAEEKTVKELKKHKKPFVIVLNTSNPQSPDTVLLARNLEEKYGVPVYYVNVQNMQYENISEIMEKVLLEFPVSQFDINLPDWLSTLPSCDEVITELIQKIKTESENIYKMKDCYCLDCSMDSENYQSICLKEIDTATGKGVYDVKIKDGLFYKTLSNQCKEEINNDFELMQFITEFAQQKKDYMCIKDALNDAREKGYGVVYPSKDQMILQEPQLIKQGGKYGVKLTAKAPSLHIMKVDVLTEVSPIVGTEKQGEDLVNYMMSTFEGEPTKIWETDIFGKSLQELVNEGLANKIYSVPEDAKTKMRKTLCRMVNENKGGIICILL